MKLVMKATMKTFSATPASGNKLDDSGDVTEEKTAFKSPTLMTLSRDRFFFFYKTPTTRQKSWEESNGEHFKLAWISQVFFLVFFLWFSF